MTRSFYRWERSNQTLEQPGVANEKIAGRARPLTLPTTTPRTRLGFDRQTAIASRLAPTLICLGHRFQLARIPVGASLLAMRPSASTTMSMAIRLREL